MSLPEGNEPDTPTLSIHPGVSRTAKTDIAPPALTLGDGSDQLVEMPPAPGPDDLVTPTAVPPTTTRPPADACPRCGGKLINPDSIGWCSKCGYCRAVEQEQFAATKKPEVVTGNRSALGIEEFGQLMRRVPKWSYVLLGGMAVVCVWSAAAGSALTKWEHPGIQAFLSTAQIIVGLTAILAAEVWGLVLIAHQDAKLSQRDLFVPTKLWAQIFARLPEMRHQVWLGGWGATAVLSGAFLIGGLGYWMDLYAPRKGANQELVAAAKELMEGDKKKVVEETSPAPEPEPTEKKANPDNRPVEQCVIIGFSLDQSEQTIATLFVGTVRSGDKKVVYVGQVKNGLTEEVSRDLLPVMRKYIVDQPVIRNLGTSRATWIAPKVFCEVHRDGYDEQGHLQKPNFARILTSLF
jgi:hypothetical protein